MSVPRLTNYPGEGNTGWGYASGESVRNNPLQKFSGFTGPLEIDPAIEAAADLERELSVHSAPFKGRGKSAVVTTIRRRWWTVFVSFCEFNARVFNKLLQFGRRKFAEVDFHRGAP